MALDLFSPVKLGGIALKNRMVMAPLTRNRAGAGGVPQALNVTYYAQRASAGLIISEATPISAMAHGYPACRAFILMSKWLAGKKWRMQYMPKAERLFYSYGMWVEFLTQVYCLMAHSR